MSKARKIGAALLATGFLFCGAESQAEIIVTPHAGADFKYWQIDPKSNYANVNQNSDFTNIFPDITAAGNFYVGTRINKIFGIDFGYENAMSKDKFHVFNGSEQYFNDFENAGDATAINFDISAWYGMFLFYWEVYPNLELIAHAGLASLQPKAKINYTLSGNAIELRQKTQSKWSGRLGLGAQYSFLAWRDFNFGIRGLVNWDQTSRIDMIGFDEDNGPFVIKPYKNATSWHIGGFVEYCKPKSYAALKRKSEDVHFHDGQPCNEEH